MVALAAMAAAALMQAMVTDGWEGVRHKVARLFGRGQPDVAIERRLDATRDQLTAAAPGDLETVQAALAAQWQTRFADLLADHPDAEADLAALVKEIKPDVTATDHSVAAGGDVTATAKTGGVAANVLHGDVHTGPTRPGPESSSPGPGSPASSGRELQPPSAAPRSGLTSRRRGSTRHRCRCRWRSGRRCWPGGRSCWPTWMPG